MIIAINASKEPRSQPANKRGQPLHGFETSGAIGRRHAVSRFRDPARSEWISWLQGGAPRRWGTGHRPRRANLALYPNGPADGRARLGIGLEYFQSIWTGGRASFIDSHDLREISQHSRGALSILAASMGSCPTSSPLGARLRAGQVNPLFISFEESWPVSGGAIYQEILANDQQAQQESAR